LPWFFLVFSRVFPSHRQPARESISKGESVYSLWGLLVNAGYLTVMKRIDSKTAVIKIPNDEVMLEFQILVAEISGVDGLLIKKDMEQFFEL